MYKVVVVGKCFILNVYYSNHLFLLIFVLYENFQVHYERKVLNWMHVQVHLVLSQVKSNVI